MQKFEEYFVAFWCLAMPITSFLIVPEIQGTTIAYMMGFLSVGLVLLKIRGGVVTRPVARYLKNIAVLGGLWLILLCGSQFGDLINPQVNMNIQGMFAISDENGLLFRSSLFTQSLYLAACVLIMLYFRYFFHEAWMKYLYWGAWFLVIYGLYDWTFYLVYGYSGDFIANRVFARDDHPGSWTQTLNFDGREVLRLKSCLGEPSFLSAVVIPYFFMAVEGRRRVLALLLFITAVLTTSTAVYLGMLASLFIQGLWTTRGRTASFAMVSLLVLMLVGLAFFSPNMYRFLVEDKISGDTSSGHERIKDMLLYTDLFSKFGPINWIFGVGFGYLYFSLLWSVTANCGLLGLGIFLYGFLKPAYMLPREPSSRWLKISMVSIVIVIAITLSELFIPTTWMFVGLAFRRLDQLKDARELEQFQRTRPFTRAPLKPELASGYSAG